MLPNSGTRWSIGLIQISLHSVKMELEKNTDNLLDVYWGLRVYRLADYLTAVIHNGSTSVITTCLNAQNCQSSATHVSAERRTLGCL